ncbi:hypothetical protein [Streptomyces sp. NPDC056387]|uniref:hypothetical protein n=1 Tax=Streptomyces sp. NPDC056387 TaxID=3345803 RepID=UPI0035D57865
MTTTAADHLFTITTLWPELLEACTTPNTSTWPPAGLRDHLQRLDTLDREEAAGYHHQRLIHSRHPDTGQPWYECVDCGHVGDGHGHTPRPDRDPAQLGERPILISVRAHDTRVAVEAALHHLATDIAKTNQRPVMSPARPHHGFYASERERRVAEQDRERRNAQARADAEHPQRWRFDARPDAVRAALWLWSRVEGHRAPCDPLGDGQRQRIGKVAAGALARIEAVLDRADVPQKLARPCQCGGVIEVHGGAGATPCARCTGCGALWTETGVIAA